MSETLTEMRWVHCEACGGSGEIIYGQTPDEHNELCGACEGTGRDCVAVSPITVDDLDQATR
jgi:DnaJ-class molecular chaperone